MKTTSKKMIFWIPRLLCICFILFISLFSFDVFTEGYGFWKAILALLIHLIPVFLLVIVLLVTWRWEWIGAVLFAALGIFYLVDTWGQLHWAAYVTISGSLFVLSILFLLNWIFRKQIRDR